PDPGRGTRCDCRTPAAGLGSEAWTEVQHTDRDRYLMGPAREGMSGAAGGGGGPRPAAHAGPDTTAPGPWAAAGLGAVWTGPKEAGDALFRKSGGDGNLHELSPVVCGMVQRRVTLAGELGATNPERKSR